ncbi:MAG: hypothetical protein KBB75_02250 [Candidatus Pacebacteria bacterium]|jgi:hypothetical protein|nr:hypothetical protein [Candidatus Paceibacterota bacterium]
MKSIKDDLFYLLTIFLAVTFFVLWFITVDRSKQGVLNGLTITLLIMGVSYFCINTERWFGREIYTLKDYLEKGSTVKIILLLEIPSKKLTYFYVIELQNGEFCTLSLRGYEIIQDPDFIFRVGVSYYFDGLNGDSVIVL